MVYKYLKFTGKFKELMPLGYKFHKLFARNYRVYRKENVWIWVMQREVMIRDLFLPNCAAVAQAIIDNTYPVYEKTIDYGIPPIHLRFEKGRPKSVIIDTQEHTLILRSKFIKENGYPYDFERYNELLIGRPTFKEVKRLHKFNLIEISEIDC